MEISGWSGQGIYVEDPLGRQFNPDAVKIHDNFIHHNQHIGENGYGVDVSAGAYALIERNAFDFNRHAIAASGMSGDYSAQQNLVLKGGGVHGKWYSEYTHLFDLHARHGRREPRRPRHLWVCTASGAPCSRAASTAPSTVPPSDLRLVMPAAKARSTMSGIRCSPTAVAGSLSSSSRPLRD